MADSESVTDLLCRWRRGDETAADELHRRYAQRLCKLAEARIGARLGRRVDPEDIVQSAFRTFFRRTARGEYRLDHSGSLWHLLVKITLRKLLKSAEHHGAGMRDVAREVCSDEDDSLHPEVVAHDPTPTEAATLADELETALRGLKPHEVDMVQLSLQGYSTPEIATKVGRSRWTVRLLLNHVGHRLRKRLTGGLGE
jgi:RNA polymerase sigma-70 factor (ECF subfamily)